MIRPRDYTFPCPTPGCSTTATLPGSTRISEVDGAVAVRGWAYADQRWMCPACWAPLAERIFGELRAIRPLGAAEGCPFCNDVTEVLRG